MALNADEQRRVYLHMGVLQVSLTGSLLGGVPELTEATQQLQVAIDSLTPNGETTVRDLLTPLDAARDEIISMRTRFQAERVGSITLNKTEFEQRVEHYDWIRMQLARTLSVPLDPASEATSGGAGGLQGPWREP
jgi:hypothetical protein